MEVTPMSSTYTGTDSDATFTANVTFKDAAGAEVEPDDIPVWTTNNANVADIASTSPDGTSATIAPRGPGSCTIVATSTDKDGTVLRSEGSVILTAGEAVVSEIDFPSATPPASVTPSDPNTPSTSATAPGAPTGATASSIDGSQPGAIPADTGAAGATQESPGAGESPSVTSGATAESTAAGTPSVTTTASNVPDSTDAEAVATGDPNAVAPPVAPTPIDEAIAASQAAQAANNNATTPVPAPSNSGVTAPSNS
jgi:hypothetical protein